MWRQSVPVWRRVNPFFNIRLLPNTHKSQRDYFTLKRKGTKNTPPMILAVIIFYYAYPYLGLSPKPVVDRVLTTDDVVATMIATNPVLSARTLIASSFTPAPTFTALPSVTPTLDLGFNLNFIPSYNTPQPELSMHLFSFYDPLIGIDKP